jgi:tetratricopeptide (TPR) repeat protein
MELGEKAVLLQGRCGPDVLGAYAVLGQALKAHVAENLVERLIHELEKLGRYDAIERENFAHLVALALAIGIDVPDARVKHLAPERVAAERNFAFRVVMEALAKDRPMVLVLEDMHWVDAATPGLLEYLQKHLAGCRLMVVATSRPEAKPVEGFEKLQLPELDVGSIGLLAEEIFVRPGPKLVKFLSDQAAGNPYFAEELARHLLERRLVRGDPAELVEEAAGRLPETLQGLLVARIDGLSEKEKETLKGASVIGRVFWEKLLQEALEREVQRELASLKTKQFVFDRELSELSGDLEYIFKHALLRDAAYSLLTKKERVRLHGMMAERLLERTGQGAGVLALAAAHLEVAGEGDRSRKLFFQAAQAAMETCVFEGALTYAQRSGEYAATLQVMADALCGLSRYQEAERRLGRALEICRDVLEEADVLLSLASVCERTSQFERVLELAAQVDCLLGNRNEVPARLIRAKAANSAAAGHFRQSRYDESLAAVGKALSLLGRVGEEADEEKVRASCLNLMGGIYYFRGEYDRSIECHTESLRIRRKIGNRLGIAASLNNMGIVHQSRGDYNRSLECHTESLEIMRGIGERNGSAMSLVNKGLVHQLLGEYELAGECHSESIGIMREIGNRYGIAMGLNGKGNVHYSRGEYELAGECYGEALRANREIGNRDGIGASLENLGYIYMARGEYGRAMESYEESVKLRREIGDRNGLAAGIHSVGIVHHYRGQYDRAIECYIEALHIRRQIGSRRGVVETSIAIACVRAERGEESEAVGSARVARSEALALGLKSQEILALRAEIEVFLELGRSIEPTTVDVLRDTDVVEGIAERVKAQALLARVHASQARPEAGLHGLQLLEHLDPLPAVYEIKVVLLQARAEVLAVAGKREESVAAARQLIQLARQSGARPMLARALFLAGEVKEASSLAAELGMIPLLRRIDKAITFRRTKAQ